MQRSKAPILSILSLEEADLILSDLSQNIIKHTAGSKLDLIAGDIDAARNDWNQAHGGWLKEIYEKLAGQPYQF